MSMARSTRRSGAVFLLLGMLGGLFFWATDPRMGPEVHHDAMGQFDWRHALYVVRGSPENVIDAANQTTISTFVGLAGSAALMIVGLWLVSRSQRRAGNRS